MADETQQTDTTAAETSTTTGATETPQDDATTTGADDAADDKSIMGAAGADADTGADDGDKGDADAGDKSKDEAAEGPPEKYELKLADDVALDEALLSEATPIFQKIGLSNEAANELMPLVGKVQERLAAAQAEAHEELGADWAKAAKADPELGGKNWAETEQFVAKALDTFGAPKGSEFRKLLDDTKLGNHPDMIRMFRAIGAAVGEAGDFVRPDGGAQVKQDRLAVLYPEDVKN